MGLADIDILLKRLQVFNGQVETSDGCCLEANQSGFDMGFLFAVSDPRDAVQISSWVCYISYYILEKEKKWGRKKKEWLTFESKEKRKKERQTERKKSDSPLRNLYLAWTKLWSM